MKIQIFCDQLPNKIYENIFSGDGFINRSTRFIIILNYYYLIYKNIFKIKEITMLFSKNQYIS